MLNKKVLTSPIFLTLPALLLVGCGSSTAPPADWTTHEGEGFTISAPASFAATTKVASNGEPLLVLERESKTPGAPFRIAVARDTNPNASADQQIKALEMLERTKATKANGGWLVEFDHDFYTHDVNVPTHYEQLMTQASDDLILNVVIVAPKSDFDEGIAEKVLAGFDVESR